MAENVLYKLCKYHRNTRAGDRVGSWPDTPPTGTVRGGATPGQGLACCSADPGEILGLHPQEVRGKQPPWKELEKG